MFHLHNSGFHSHSYGIIPLWHLCVNGRCFSFTYVSHSVSALRQQPLLVLRLGVLTGHLGALQTPRPADGRQGASLLHPETPRPLDLQQAGAPDTDLPDGS